MDNIWHLTEQDFFWQLQEEKKDFISLATRRSMEKNQFIFREGDPGDAAFYLEEGTVRIFRISSWGKEIILSLRQPGAMFGLAEIMAREKRIFSARAMTPCQLLRIDRREFKILLRRHPPLSERVIETLGGRLRYLGEHIESMMIGDVPARLLKMLLCLSCQHIQDLSALDRPIRIPVKLTQEQLAAMIGSSQQTVSETLKKLKEEGLLEVSAKEIIILRPKEICERVLI